MPRKNDPTIPSLLQEGLLDETGGFGVVRARFEVFERSSFEDLIAGYSSLKVLTYSSSVSIVNRAAEQMERLEVVFGRADILGEMASYLHYQELLIKDLISATKGKDHIKEKIESGAIKLYVVQEIVSHEKLFLLEGDSGTRVVTGSANFSDRAFSGAQNESYVCFDNDPAAWQHFNAAYERIKDRSTTSIIERAQIDGEFDPKKLPALAPARKGSAVPKVVLVQDAPPETSIVHRAAAKPPKRYGDISSAVQAKGGMAKIDRPAAQRAIRHVRSNWRTREENPEESLSIHLASGQISLSGNPLDLDVSREDVASDARAWVAYFDGYRVFRGEHEKLARLLHLLELVLRRPLPLRPPKRRARQGRRRLGLPPLRPPLRQEQLRQIRAREDPPRLHVRPGRLPAERLVHQGQRARPHEAEPPLPARLRRHGQGALRAAR